MNSIEIGALNASAETLAMLADLLVETVAAGGSVSFMHPLAPEAANVFWERSLAAAAKDERVVLGAWDGKVLPAPSRCCSTAHPTSRTGPRSPS